MQNFGIPSEILSIAVALRSPARLLPAFGIFARIFTKCEGTKGLLKSCLPTTKGVFPTSKQLWSVIGSLYDFPTSSEPLVRCDTCDSCSGCDCTD